MGDPIYDTAVVGAGPAGCSAAIELAHRGARVALVEANSIPHDKLCGEFLSPECRGLLDHLCFGDQFSALQPARIEAVRFVAPDGTAWSLRLPTPGWGLSRRELDARLAAAAAYAGAYVVDRATVTGIHGSLLQGYQLDIRSKSRDWTLHSRTVISAHGKRSTLDRTLGRSFLRQPQPFVALKAHFQGPPLQSQVQLYTFPGGYCGLAEIEQNRINVCLLVREEFFRPASSQGPDSITAFLDWMQLHSPHLHERLVQMERIDPRWLVIAQVPFENKSVTQSGLLMAGDAGGLIAPLAGDGIAMALRGGILAAAFCARFLSGELSSEELPGAYASEWTREFNRRLRWGRILQSVLLRPRLSALALRVANAMPPVGDYLFKQTRNVS